MNSFRFGFAEWIYLGVMVALCLAVKLYGCYQDHVDGKKVMALEEMALKLKKIQNEKQKDRSGCCACNHIVILTESELQEIARKAREIPTDLENGGWI